MRGNERNYRKKKEGECKGKRGKQTHSLNRLTMVGSFITLKKSMYSQTGRNRNNDNRPRTCSSRRWWMPVSFKTFFDIIFCSENPSVADSAQINPNISNDISVIVAIATPVIIGTKLKYTDVACFSLKNIRVNITVNNGIVALTRKCKKKKTKQKLT